MKPATTSLRVELRRISVIAVLATAVTMLISLNVLFFVQYSKNVKFFGQNITQFISDQIAPSILIDDWPEVDQRVSILLNNPDLGALAVQIKSDGKTKLYGEPTKERAYEFTVPIKLANSELGELSVFVSTKQLWSFIFLSVSISAILIFLAFAFSGAITRRLYTEIQMPVDQILRFLRNVEKENNYSMRLELESLVELRRIAEGINSMLAEIHKRDENLEALVIERTRELIAKQNELRQTLSEMEKLSNAKNLFLANVSHELRTPLNGIRALTDELVEKLNKGTINTDKILDDLHHIKNSAQILADLVNDLLDFSKILNNKFEFHDSVFDVREAVDSVLTIFEDQAEKKSIKLIYENLPNEIYVIGDRLRFCQVIMNLVSNAIKFTDSGFVKISIKLTNPPQNFIGQATTSTEQEPQIQFFEISVEDTGCGIDEEKVSLIFEPFTQVDSSFSRKQTGLGLGLSIVKQIIERYNGTISVQNKKEGGAVFTVTLGLRRAETKPSTVENIIPTLEGRTILIVEDNPTNMLIAERLTSKTGANIQKAWNGVEAVNYFLNGNKADLVLMDIQMPEMDGIEATRRILQLNRQVPIIALTAHAFPEELNRYVEAGCIDTVTKPIDRKKFYSTLARYLSDKQHLKISTHL